MKNGLFYSKEDDFGFAVFRSIVQILGIIFVICFCFGCEETQKTALQTATTVDPMSVLVRPNKQWTDKYGDSRDSQLIFTLIVLDEGNRGYHLALTEKLIDPNDPNSIESRLRKLESAEFSPAEIIMLCKGLKALVDSNEPTDIRMDAVNIFYPNDPNRGK